MNENRRKLLLELIDEYIQDDIALRFVCDEKDIDYLQTLVSSLSVVKDDIISESAADNIIQFPLNVVRKS